MQNSQYQGPWYRGGVPRSYVPPSIFASVGFAICLTFVAVFMIFAGSIMTGVAYQKPQPPFDTPFFIEHSKNDPIRTVGPVVLGIGLTILVISIILCCVAAGLAKKQENERHARQQAGQPCIPQEPLPPSAYPHQPPPQNMYPTATNYPTQSVDQDAPVNYYPPYQSQYPSQPATTYPPSQFPPSGNQYPYPDYPQPMQSGVPAQNPHYNQPSLAPTQPYQYNEYSKQSNQSALDSPPSYDAVGKQ